MNWKRLNVPALFPALFLAVGFASCDHASGIREPVQKNDASVDAGGPGGNGGDGPVGTGGTAALGTGGLAGTGGSAGMARTGGSGGTVSTGGSSSTGGTVGTGGTAATGGITAQGMAGAAGGAPAADGGLSIDAQGKDGPGTPDATQCIGTPAQPGHRPQALACPAANAGLGATSDGGLFTCAADLDCQNLAGLARWCHLGKCRVDQCLTDSECATGMACGCATDFGGNAIHTNLCLVSGCRVDADCGAGSTCSPSHSTFCGSLTGFYCHAATDTCTTDADCCGDSTRPACRYQPALGHWACDARGFCAG